MSRHFARHLWVVLVVLLGVILPACSPAASTPTDEEAQVYAYANPMAENLLNSMKNNDYQGFIKDYDEVMTNATPQSSFDTLKQTFDIKLGEYQSYKTAGVQKTEEYVIVYYTLTFSKAPEVTMRLVFLPEEPHLITGLWFNSPELAQ